jgi:SAM-dependent methyltransferase
MRPESRARRAFSIHTEKSMHRARPHPLRFTALLLALALAAPACAQSKPPQQEYTPQVGQEGKDVIWVPTPHALVERMLDMAKVTPKDFVIDLGSGDGRTVIAAAKRGARALGIEYNPDLVELSRRSAEKEGVASRAQFVRADIFESDFSQATVITLYLLPSLNLKLRPAILKMKPGTRVVSHAFNMDDWQPDQTDSVDGRTAYLWIVPARVEGTWRFSLSGNGPKEYELVLRQHFQQVEGLVRLDGKTGQVRNIKLVGDQISLSIYEPTGSSPIRRDFAGRISGNTIEGSAKLPGGEVKWSATRVN